MATGWKKPFLMFLSQIAKNEKPNAQIVTFDFVVNVDGLQAAHSKFSY